VGAGAVRRLPSGLLARVRRWHLFAVLGVIVGGAVLYGRAPSHSDAGPPPRRDKTPPPVGAYSITNAAGETEFAMQTETGKFGLKVGSRAFEDMPYGFPFYPGAKLIDSANMQGGAWRENGRFVRFETIDSPEKVVDFYRRLAQASKLRIVTDERVDQLFVLAGAHPTRRDGGFQLTVSRDGKGKPTEGRLTAGFGQDVEQLPEPDPETANALMMANITAQSADSLPAP
jgi:hypothetical protein